MYRDQRLTCGQLQPLYKIDPYQKGPDQPRRIGCLLYTSHVHKIGLDYIRLNIMSFGCDIGGRGFEGFYQYDSLSQSWQLKKTTYHWVS